jgi:hypothetical protein
VSAAQASRPGPSWHSTCSTPPPRSSSANSSPLGRRTRRRSASTWPCRAARPTTSWRSPETVNDWAVAVYGAFIEPYYPTTLGGFNTGGAFNAGSYSNAEADKLINASVTSGNPVAVKAEASYLTQQQPSLFMPNFDFITVWKDNVSGQPAAIEATTQYYLNTELMHLTK